MMQMNRWISIVCASVLLIAVPVQAQVLDLLDEIALRALAADPACRAVAAYVEGFGPGHLLETALAADRLRQRGDACGVHSLPDGQLGPQPGGAAQIEGHGRRHVARQRRRRTAALDVAERRLFAVSLPLERDGWRVRARRAARALGPFRAHGSCDATAVRASANKGCKAFPRFAARRRTPAQACAVK